MSDEPSSHERFSEAYAGVPPWEIGKPQRPFVAVADQVESPLLDAGCGSGNTALFFAARGHQVTGIDFVEAAIDQARAKTAARSLTAEFLVKDAMTLSGWDRRFRSVIDSGLFHIFVDEERKRYAKGLAHVTASGGRLFLLGFTDEPRARGPAGVSLGDSRRIRERLDHRVGVAGPRRSQHRLRRRLPRGRPKNVVLDPSAKRMICCRASRRTSRLRPCAISL